MEVPTGLIPAGTSAGPRKSLEHAIQDFQAILTSDQRQKLSSIGAIRDPDTVMIFTAQLDRDNQLKKGRGIACRLSSVLQSVQAFSAVVDTFVSSRPEIAALVWGSVKLAMLIAVNYTSYFFESLSALFMELSSQCPRFAEYQALYATSTRLQEALCDFHASIIRCCKHAVQAIQRSWQEHLKLALFRSFNQEFEPDANEIQRLGKKVKDEIKFAKAQTDHQDQVLQEKERAAASKQRSWLRTLMPKVESSLNSMEKSEVQRSKRRSINERQQLLESLSSHNYRTPFAEARKKHHYSTAEWIFTTPEFTRWYEGTGSVLLWCSGKIGSGKTILCANVINHVLVKKNRDDRVAFFFLEYDKSDSLTAETIIRSIIRQSIDTTTLPEHIEHQLRELDRKHFVYLQEWTSLLRQGIGNTTVFFIFIDGLDECDAAERRALLDELSSLATTTSGLRIFITSRDSVDIDLRVRFSHMERVAMAPVNVASDIRIYAGTIIQERMRNQDLVFGDPHLQEVVEDMLTRHADGMFLWIKFLMNEVCTASCDDDIRQTLRNLPKDLEETFARALSRILVRRQKPKLVQKVFRWVAAAKRPLTLDEIREAVSVDIGQSRLTTGQLVPELSPIVFWCENLIQLTDEKPQSLHFAHSTIRDFIIRSDLPSQLCDFHVDLKEADHFAGEVCVTYLHLEDFATTVARRSRPFRVNPVAIAGSALGRGPRVTKLTTRFAETVGHSTATLDPDLAGNLVSYDRVSDLDRLQHHHPFLKYAAEYWVFHTVNFQKGISETWTSWLRIITNGHGLVQIPWQESKLQPKEQAVLIWSHQMRHYALLRYANSIPGLPDSKRVELMRISAAEGDTEATAIFLDTGCSTIGIDSALQAASERGHIHIVKLLLDARADVNATAAKYGGQTVLQAASRGGHIHIVKLLLEAGADINAAAAESGGRTALQAASERGHIHIVKLLLDARADVNATAAKYGGQTVLQGASRGGHIHIVKLLLEAGADANAVPTDSGYTALQAASKHGHTHIVELLLKAGADPNAVTFTGQYDELIALQVESEGGHPHIVDLLLEAGADPSAVTKYERRTALQVASERGHTYIIELLLEAGAK